MLLSIVVTCFCLKKTSLFHFDRSSVFDILNLSIFFYNASFVFCIANGAKLRFASVEFF